MKAHGNVLGSGHSWTGRGEEGGMSCHGSSVAIREHMKLAMAVSDTEPKTSPHKAYDPKGHNVRPHSHEHYRPHET